MEKIGEIIETIEILKQVEEFKELSDTEIRELAVEVIKINTLERIGLGVSNAVKYSNRESY